MRDRTPASSKTDQANVETAEINLGYTRITSPVDGRVGIRQVDVGNIVSANQAAGIVVVTELVAHFGACSQCRKTISPRSMPQRVSGGALAQRWTLTTCSQTSKIASGVQTGHHRQ